MAGALPPPLPPRAPQKRQVDQLEAVNRLGDTIAGPNLRPKDNLVQLGACVGTAVLGAIAGLWWERSGTGALLGCVAGLLVGLFLSGIVQMVVGFLRASKRGSTL